MVIEKKTLIYIFIGLLYISTAVVLQAGWNNNSSIHYLLFGNYKEDSHPDLVLEDSSLGSVNGDLSNFIYSGHYVTETAGLAEGDGFHEGIFLFRLGNNNFLKKKYNSIPPNSSVRIAAFNDIIFSSDVNQSYHCENLKMDVKQDKSTLETLDVENTDTMDDFRVETKKSSSESTITLSIKPNRECGNKPQILGIDKFYLEKFEDVKNESVH